MEQRNHISRRLALQTRRVSATELAHSLDTASTREDGGGEWATEAAHGCLSAELLACDRILALAGGLRGARERAAL